MWSQHKIHCDLDSEAGAALTEPNSDDHHVICPASPSRNLRGPGPRCMSSLDPGIWTVRWRNRQLSTTEWGRWEEDEKVSFCQSYTVLAN